MKKTSILVVTMLFVGTLIAPLALALSNGDSVYIPEDLNGDGFVDRADLRIVLANWGSCSRDRPAVADSDYVEENGAAIRTIYYRCLGDVNLDEKVDMEDILRILEAWNPKPSSDLNGDGKIDKEDLKIVLDEWGKKDSKADLNRDGTVDMNDVVILLRDWTKDNNNGRTGTNVLNKRGIGPYPDGGPEPAIVLNTNLN